MTRKPMACLLFGLPNEILQYIAAILPTDQDLVNLGSVCKEANARVLHSDALTWRSRFHQEYDVPRGRSSGEISLEYKLRAVALRQIRRPEFDFEQSFYSHPLPLWLRVIHTMVSEILSLPLEAPSMSKTLERLREIIRPLISLGKPRSGHPSSVFYGVQLCLTALALDPEICTTDDAYEDYDVDRVYSYTTPPDGPFIRLDNLDFATLLSMRNFWRKQFLKSSLTTFHDSFLGLSQITKPQIKKMDATSSMSPSSSWVGYYSCVHPLPGSLDDLKRRQTCADLNTHWDTIEILSFEIQSRSLEPFWPESCRQIIPQSYGPGINRQYFIGYQSIFGAFGDKANPFSGFIESTEMPQGGFVGWSRIWFAIFENAKAAKEMDWSKETPGWVHEYEAVILPGGRIMLGRWLDLKNPSGRGPFMLWDLC